MEDGREIGVYTRRRKMGKRYRSLKLAVVVFLHVCFVYLRVVLYLFLLSSCHVRVVSAIPLSESLLILTAAVGRKIDGR